MRGSHQQDMEGWPGYWEGFPPMHYATHCVSLCLALLGKLAEHVVCHGSGRIAEHLIPKYGSPFAIETRRDILDRGDEADDEVFFAQRRDRHALLHVLEIFRGR